MAKETFFRNKEMITEGLPEPIDAGCLWELVDENLVLVDDDQYIALGYEQHKDLFEESKS